MLDGALEALDGALQGLDGAPDPTLEDLDGTHEAVDGTDDGAFEGLDRQIEALEVHMHNFRPFGPLLFYSQFNLLIYGNFSTQCFDVNFRVSKSIPQKKMELISARCFDVKFNK